MNNAEAAGILTERLASAVKIAFLGVGSPLRSDDSVGLYIVTRLQELLTPDCRKELSFYLGESAPENFSGEIRRRKPSHVVIFDAADLGEEPGTFAIIERERIGGVSFSTHTLPLKILADYLVQTIDCQVIVLGIQPKLREFAYPMSGEVKEAADGFLEEFGKAFSPNLG
ncbi:MAG: hydrogenase maturation peptidase HycI [Bacillota bacterium]